MANTPPEPEVDGLLDVKEFLKDGVVLVDKDGVKVKIPYDKAHGSIEYRKGRWVGWIRRGHDGLPTEGA